MPQYQIDKFLNIQQLAVTRVFVKQELYSTDIQRQTAVTAYLSSKQLLLFVFVEYSIYSIINLTKIEKEIYYYFLSEQLIVYDIVYIDLIC